MSDAQRFLDRHFDDILDELVAEGVLEARPLPGGGTGYWPARRGGCKRMMDT